MSRNIWRFPSISDVYLLTTMCRFLLASLIIDAILREKTVGRRKKKLAEMAGGKELGDAYTATLKQLKPQEGDTPGLGLQTLMWLSCSERPLRVDELCQAMAVEIGSADPDPENAPTLQELLASCLGLVTVESSSSTVRLVHFTLQQHLLDDPTIFHCPHSTIAKICLTYLNFASVRNLSPTLDSAPSTMPLLEYSSCHWGDHAKRGMTKEIEILTLSLLEKFDEHISAHLLLLRYFRQIPFDICDDAMSRATGFTGLHGAAFFGITKILAPMLEMKKWDVDATDFTGRTALMWAVEHKHDEAVEMLSERNGVRSTEPSILHQVSSMWPLKLLYPPRKSGTHPNNTRPALPIVVNRYWVIGSCICLLAFLAHRKNSHN